MTEALGLIVLILATIAVKVLAVPVFIGTFFALATVIAGFVSIALIAVALGCRARDKIRGGI